MTDNEILAYMAGLFDGEGSIHMSGRYRRATIVTTFTNTDIKLCQVFSNKWGGNISSAQPPNGKQIFRWYRCGQKVKPFLDAISPYAIGKRRLIELALKWLSLKGKSGQPLKAEILKQRQTIAQSIYTLQRHRLLI